MNIQAAFSSPVYYQPPYVWIPRSKGMGDTSPQQINSIVTAGASATVGILTALHAVILGTAITGPVGALIGAGIVALSLVANLIVSQFSGCGNTCIQASLDANKFANLLQQNHDAYFAVPLRHQSLQAAALNNVDTLFAALKSACSDPSLGAAGQRCISERLVRGGTAPWCPNPGHTGCDWYVLYRDPIANDSAVVPDPVPGQTTSAPSTSPSTSGGIPPAPGGTSGSTGATGATGSTPATPSAAPLLIGGALILALLLL